MSLGASLFNAYTGLTAAARAAGTISQNVANAQTEGYGRREVERTATSVAGRGTGVRITAVLRDVDALAIASRRVAQADLGRQGVRADAFARLETVIGIPGEAGSTDDLVTRFEAALVSAESRPDSGVRLQNVLYAASDLSAKINQIAQATQDLRMEADGEIYRQVGELNTLLSRIAELNRDIRVQFGTGNSTNGLMDQRQVLIDRLADIVPLKTVPRDKGQIAVLTTGGAVLFDGLAAEFGFTPAGLITADMTLASGALSGLTLNGKPVAMDDATGLMRGGTLAAEFERRDSIAPQASTQADALARNLVERFQASGLDPTTTPGEAGLFTDGGGVFDLADEPGLAARLAVNSVVDPAQGGDLWRLRSGLGATTLGDVGDNSLLSGFLVALTMPQTAASGQYSSAAKGFSGLAGELAALNSAARLNEEASESFAQARFQELKQAELAAGVDTDQEMQKLLLIEQAYAANARVVSTVDAMLATILEL